MYIPNANRVDDVAALHDLMQQFPFAPIVTEVEGAPFASHLPFLLDGERGKFGTLRGHIARPNVQWQGFSGEREALVIFQGPHAYISPLWYAKQPAVPTWNYAVVHAYGVPRCVGEEALRSILQDMVKTFEAPDSPLSIPEDYFTKLSRGVVGFEIEITRVEGKFKLGQGRVDGDRDGVIEALERSSRPGDRETAAWMEALARRSTEAP